MHDLHAANKILNQALAYAKKNKLRRVSKIEIELGTIIEHGEDISPADLKFNLKLLSRGSIAEKAKVKVKKLKKKGFLKLKAIEGSR